MGKSIFFRNLRIRTRLVVSYSALFVLAVTLGSTIIYFRIQKTIEANIENKLTNTTTTTLKMVEIAANVSIRSYLRAVAEKNRETVEDIYLQYQRGALSEDQAMSRARRILLSQKVGESGYLYCVDSSGVLRVHPKPLLRGADISFYPFIRKQIERKNGYLEYEWKNPGEPKERPKALYMTYFKPWDWIITASAYREEFRKLVNVDDVRDYILALRLGRSGYSYILDSNGNIVVHHKLRGNVYDVRDAEGRQFVHEICALKSGKIAYSWKNPGESVFREKIAIFNYIPEYDWIVVSSVYIDDYHQPLYTIRNIITAKVALLLLLILPITFWIASTIIRPLRELTNRFDAGTTGDLGVRMEIEAEDEVGQLSEHFNRFMEKLEKSSAKLQEEIRTRRLAEEELRLDESRANVLLQLNQMTAASLQEIIAFTYEEAIKLTRSKIGYVAFMSEDEKVLTIQYWTREVMKKCGIIDKPIVFSVEKTGLLGEVVRRRRPVITNDYAAPSPLKRGYPEGHVKLVRHMSIPVFEGEKIVAVAGVGNKEEDYNESDIRQLTLLMQGMWRLIQRNRLEQEMNNMRLYLKNVIDSMPSVLVGVDNKGRITHWNREAEKVSGMVSDNACGKPLSLVFPGLQLQIDRVLASIHEKKLTKMEKVAHEILGEKRLADVTIYPLIANGPEGAVILVEDVTERARIDEMMIQTEKILSIGGLAAGMAHEINNPLSSILQSTQLVLLRLSADHPKNRKAAQAVGIDLGALQAYLQDRGVVNFLTAIRESGQRAVEIIENMLDFSRKSESQMVPTPLANLLDRTVELAAHDFDLKKKYDFRSIEIVRDFDPTLPDVPCSVTEIEQVILNLLRNAAQAMTKELQEGKAPRITLRLKKEGKMARLEIEDNGPGMDAAVCRHIFDPFFTTKEPGMGTGLGLSVSYFIISDKHGGTLAVESAPGQGARFILRLPIDGKADQ